MATATEQRTTFFKRTQQLIDWLEERSARVRSIQVSDDMMQVHLADLDELKRLFPGARVQPRVNGKYDHYEVESDGAKFFALERRQEAGTIIL